MRMPRRPTPPTATLGDSRPPRPPRAADGTDGDRRATAITVLAVLWAAAAAISLSAQAPSRLISRQAPAFASSAESTAGLANDEDYATEWRSSGQPAWLAYDLSGVPAARRAAVVVSWYTNSGGDYDASVLPANKFHNVPGPYLIEGHRGPGGGGAPLDGWAVLASSPVPQAFHTSQHLIRDFRGYNWIRLRTTGPNAQNDPVNPDVAINLDVHSASPDDVDSWVFYGDSLTAECWSPGAFARLVRAAQPEFEPPAINAGIPFLKAGDAVPLVERWLPLFPGRYVGIAYGTNDVGIAPTTYASHLARLVDLVLAAGKVPLVATIPWASPEQRDGPAIRALNREIARLLERYAGRVVAGPDLYGAFFERRDLLRDGLHPNEAGIRVMQRAWADVAVKSFYGKPPR